MRFSPSGLVGLALALFACSVYEKPSRRAADNVDGTSGSSNDAGKAGGSGDSGGNPASGAGPLGGGGANNEAGNATAGFSVGGDAEGGETTTAGNGGSAGTTAGGSAGTTAGGGQAGSGGAAVDRCPDDPAKTAPGDCGCGIPDADTAALGSCKGLKSALAHRYDFEGTGTDVTDSVADLDGTIVGSATLSKLDGKGVVVLSGGTSGPYVNLPNGILSALTNATLEAWVTWRGGSAWQRIFDFGDSTSATPEDNPASGKSYLFLTPMSDTDAGSLARAVFSLNGNATTAETRVDGVETVVDRLTQFVVVIDDAGGKLSLYMDGKPAGEQPFSASIGSLNDVNAWLGRSQYNADPELTATYHDFRIYKAALTAAQIATSFKGGPDAAFLR
jgi:hypothetical protein